MSSMPVLERRCYWPEGRIFPVLGVLADFVRSWWMKDWHHLPRRRQRVVLVGLQVLGLFPLLRTMKLRNWHPTLRPQRLEMVLNARVLVRKSL